MKFRNIIMLPLLLGLSAYANTETPANDWRSVFMPTNKILVSDVPMSVQDDVIQQFGYDSWPGFEIQDRIRERCKQYGLVNQDINNVINHILKISATNSLSWQVLLNAINLSPYYRDSQTSELLWDLFQRKELRKTTLMASYARASIDDELYKNAWGKILSQPFSIEIRKKTLYSLEYEYSVDSAERQRIIEKVFLSVFEFEKNDRLFKIADDFLVEHVIGFADSEKRRDVKFARKLAKVSFAEPPPPATNSPTGNP